MTNMKTKVKWTLAALSALAILLLVSYRNGIQTKEMLLKNMPFSLTLDLEKLTDREKCPACFGVNLCPPMLLGNVKLTHWTKYSVSKMINQNNVFYGTFTDARSQEKKVVLKKLAQDHELENLDQAICDRHGASHICNPTHSIRKLLDHYAMLPEAEEEELSLHSDKIGPATDALLCPSKTKMQYLMNAAYKFNKGQHKTTIAANALTAFLLNPEPLILQAFPPSKGFPFPRYYGSCGRIAMEEYVGPPLTEFIGKPFRTRATISLQLLKIAQLFHENDSGFILYINNVSPERFAVDPESLDVKLVDAQNILVVDRNQLGINEKEVSTDILESRPSFCPGKGNINNECFQSPLEELCTRPATDQNYFAICYGLLAPESLAYKFPQGFLHSIPSEDMILLPLSALLEECKIPGSTKLKLTRKEAAKQITSLLSTYLKSPFH